MFSGEPDGKLSKIFGLSLCLRFVSMSSSKNLAPLKIGWREYVDLPEFGIHHLKVKIDTGARTSAIHAHVVRTFDKDNVAFVEFELLKPAAVKKPHFSLPIFATRSVKNTGGIAEIRYSVMTKLIMGDRAWNIETTLADRTKMKYGMIIGRRAIRRRKISVDPGRSYLCGKSNLE